MNLSQAELEVLMDEAIVEGKSATRSGEVPVGAVISIDGKIISRAYNSVEACSDVTCHAEMLAIRKASEKIGNWRLESAVLCVTLEPCTMCIGAIQLARIPLLVFGASEKQMGAVGSRYDLTLHDSRLRVVSGVRKDECAELLKEFFLMRRDGRVVEGA